MVGHQPEEYKVVKGKQTSAALRWTLVFFILIIWGALMAYIGWLSAQTIFTKTVIDDLGEVDDALEDANTDDGAMAMDEEVCDEPVVVYERPGLISDTDKARLQTHVLNPIQDFYADISAPNCTNLVAVIIEALPESEQTSNYRFTESRITKEGAYGSSVLPDDLEGQVDWWTFDCLDGNCGLSDAFYETYPNYQP